MEMEWNTTISLLREALASSTAAAASAGQKTRAPCLLPPCILCSRLRCFACPRRDGLGYAEEEAVRPERLAHRRVEHPLSHRPHRVGKHQLQPKFTTTSSRMLVIWQFFIDEQKEQLGWHNVVMQCSTSMFLLSSTFLSSDSASRPLVSIAATAARIQQDQLSFVSRQLAHQFIRVS